MKRHLFLALALFVGMPAGTGNGESLVSTLSDEAVSITSSFTGERIVVWKDTVSMVAAFPVAGSGYGTFASAYPLFRSPEVRKYNAHAHNDPLQALAEGGIVGALLRQARLEADLSQKELAEVLGCSAGRLSSYEYGKQPIPLAELELLAQHLDLPLEHFLDDQEGPVGEWHRRQETIRYFYELPEEVQEFVSRPINAKYLEVAMKLAEMPAGGLRDIAEGLLDITY